MATVLNSNSWLAGCKVMRSFDSRSSQLRELTECKKWTAAPTTTVVNSDSRIKEKKNVASSDL